MMMGDFLSLAQLGLPVKVVVLNNGTLGFVELEMKASGFLDSGCDLKNPNFAAMAEAVGVKGVRVEQPQDLGAALTAAFAPSTGRRWSTSSAHARSSSMPPKTTLAEAAGFGLFMLKAVLNGRATSHRPRQGEPHPVDRGRAKAVKRFYSAVTLGQSQDGSRSCSMVGPSVRRARNVLCAPSQPLAEAIADEWREQGEQIETHSMPLNRLATTAVDLMPARRGDAVTEAAEYAATDLLCYRAVGPASLVQRQVDGLAALAGLGRAPISARNWWP